MSKTIYGKEYFESNNYQKLAQEKKEISLAFFDLLYKRTGKIRSVLDLGCGEGDFVEFCQKKNLLTYGIDVSRFALQKARHKSKTDFIAVNLNKGRLPFKNNYFDAIVSFDLLEHLSSTALVMTEAFRVLKPNGIFFMTTPNGSFWFRDWLKFCFGEDKTHLNVCSSDFWKKEFYQAGFQKIEIKGCFLFGLPPTLIARCFFKKLRLPTLIKPLFSPFLDLAPTLFIFARK